LSTDLVTIAAVAGIAAIASPAGGLIALWRQPTTLFMSMALGFASGVLLATIGFEMVPKALELGSLSVAVAGFVAGFLAVYGFDLFIHRGRLAGKEAQEHRQVERFYWRHRPRGDEVTVLAGGTSAEELIEGLSIGVGAVIEPGLGLLIALAIVIDNLSEGLSIGEIIRAGGADQGHGQARRILGWTGLIGAALFGSALAGWFFLRGMPEPVLGFLFAVGAGGMFYLTITDLVPQAEERHYQQSGAVATAAGFMTIFVLSTFF
jgi:zinc transporter, ZIP family